MLGLGRRKREQVAQAQVEEQTNNEQQAPEVMGHIDSRVEALDFLRIILIDRRIKLTPPGYSDKVYGCIYDVGYYNGRLVAFWQSNDKGTTLWLDLYALLSHLKLVTV
jgi:hypothetical protein